MEYWFCLAGVIQHRYWGHVLKTRLEKTKPQSCTSFSRSLSFSVPGRPVRFRGGALRLPVAVEETFKQQSRWWKRCVNTATWERAPMCLLQRLRKASYFLNGSMGGGGIFECNYVKVCALVQLRVGKGHSYLMA